MANVAIPTNAVDLEGLGDASPTRAPRRSERARGRGRAVRGAVHRHDARERAQRELGLRALRRRRDRAIPRADGSPGRARARAPTAASASARCSSSSSAPREAVRPCAPSAPPSVPTARRASPSTPVPAPSAPAARRPARRSSRSALPASLAALGGAEPTDAPAEPTPAQFVTALLPEAKAAAAALGVEPRLLLAQAALETGWGRAVPQRGGESAQQSVRHQGRSVVVRRRRGAVDARARRRRDGAAARAVQGVRQHGRELRGLRRLDLHGAALRGRARAGRRPGSLRARRDEGRLRDRSRSTRTSGSRSITAIVSSKRCAASICRRRHPNEPHRELSWRTS